MSKRMSPPNRIDELRLSKQPPLTYEQIAERCIPRVTASEISKLAKGQRRLTHEWMLRISAAIGCDPRDLLSSADTPDREWLLTQIERLLKRRIS